MRLLSQLIQTSRRTIRVSIAILGTTTRSVPDGHRMPEDSQQKTSCVNDKGILFIVRSFAHREDLIYCVSLSSSALRTSHEQKHQ